MYRFLKDHHKPFLLIVFFSLIFFHPIAFQGKVLFFGDNLSLKLPNTIYAISRLRLGHFPLWNPHSLAGMPFFADLSNTLLYPFTFIFLVLNPLSALNIQVIISIILALVFTYALAKTYKLSTPASLLAATIFGFSSSLIHYTSYLNLLNSSIWLPLTILSLHQSLSKSSLNWTIAAAISLSLQILGGHPQPVYYTLILMVLYTLFVTTKHKLLSRTQRLLSVVLVAAGLTAVVVIPATQLTLLSTRTSLNFATATTDSLHPALLIRLVLPSFFDHPQLGYSWGPAWRQVAGNTGYIGVTSMILIGLCLLKRKSSLNTNKAFSFFLAISLLALTFSLGRFTPIYKIAFHTAPLFSSFRGPAEALLIFNFSAAIISGFALDYASTASKLVKLIKKLAIITLVISTLTIFVSQNHFDKIHIPISQFHTLLRDQVIVSNISVNLILSSLLIFFSIHFFHKKLLYLVVLVVFTDLLIFNTRYLFHSSNDLIIAASNTAQQLTKLLTPQQRFLSYQDVQPFTGLGNYWENMTLKPPFAQSYVDRDELHSRQILNQRLDHLALNWHLPHQLSTPNGYSSFLIAEYLKYTSASQSSNLNNLNFASLPASKLDQLAVAYTTSSQGITHRPSFLPRSRLLNQTGEYLKPATIVVDQPEKIIIYTNQTLPTTLVLADTYYPGWQAKINSVTEPIIKHSNIFRAVSLPPGKNIVEFSFKPRILKLSAIISLTTLTFIAITILNHRLNEK